MTRAMTSLLYPSEIPNSESQLNDQFLTYQRLSSVIADSQLQILFDYTEERINGLRLNDRLSSLHATLLRSGLQLFRLEMELATQDDSCESLPGCNLVNFQRTDELGLETIATEIDNAKHIVNQCGQKKFMASYEVTILLCGLKLLEVEWDKFATGTPDSVQIR